MRLKNAMIKKNIARFGWVVIVKYPIAEFNPVKNQVRKVPV
jgi:hypothetical protein